MQMNLLCLIPVISRQEKAKAKAKATIVTTMVIMTVIPVINDTTVPVDISIRMTDVPQRNKERNGRAKAMSRII